MNQGHHDVVLVGGGGAALCLLHQLALNGPAGLSVLVVDPVDRLAHRPQDRTWCFWGAGGTAVDDAVTRTWTSVVVRSAGADLDLDLRPLRYAMLRSADYAALVAAEVDRAAGTRGLRVEWLADAVESVADGDPAARVSTRAHGVVTARWAFDSRPTPPARPARTSLLQHFRGAFVHDPDGPFDPDRAVLMDFTTPQPAGGLSFGYVLPTSRTEALVEYTEFSRQPLDDQGYDRALSGYLARVAGPRVRVEGTEQGAIPMTDARHRRRTGRGVFHVGTAGGATRASTGYTFSAMQRQARGVAGALAAGRDPLPPPAYPRRHRAADAALLRALDSGGVDGPAFFTRLFERNPPSRVLGFLDGTGSAAADLAVVASAPRGAMTRASAWLLLHPVRSRATAARR